MKYLLLIILVPIALLLCIGLVLYMPVDFIRYGKSQYYKDTKEKYRWLMGMSSTVRMYDMIKANALAVEYIKPEGVMDGYFLYRDFLILDYYDWEYSYDKKIGGWTTEIEDEYIKIEEVVNQDIQEFNEFMKSEVVKRAVVLIDADKIDEYELSDGEDYKFLMVTKETMTAELQKFIEENR